MEPSNKIMLDLRLLVAVAALLGACGDADGSAPAIANGTCAFSSADLGDGSVDGSGYALMNGTGNARVLCGDFSDGAEQDSLELAIGNGNYVGPGEYWLDSSTANGFLTLTVGDVEYSSRWAAFGGSCHLVVTDAFTPDEDVPLPPAGSPITGTFECTSIGLFGDDLETIDIAGGEFRVVLR